MANHIGAPLITIPGIRESLKDMIENGAEIQGNAACYFSGLSNAVENSASLTLVPNNSQEGNIKAMTPGIGSENFIFQRNTSATRINKDGIEVVGNNIARLDYSNGDCPEILIEPQATNLVQSNYTEPYSDNLANASEITYFQDSPFSEDIPNAVSEGMAISSLFRRYEYVFSENQLEEGQIYTFSWYTKRLQEPNLEFVGDFQFSSPINIEVGNPIQIESDINGFNRFQVNFTVIDENELSRFRAYYGRANGDDDVVRILYAGMQIEEGENATSVILTNGTIATRNADIIQPLLNVPELIGQSEGSVFIDTVLLRTGRIFVLGVNNNEFLCDFDTSGRMRLIFRKDGNIFNTLRTSINQFTGRVKILCVYSNGFLKLYVNGILIDEQTPLDTFPVFNNYTILGSTLGGNSIITNHLPIKSTYLFKTALSDEEAINLTTI